MIKALLTAALIFFILAVTRYAACWKAKKELRESIKGLSLRFPRKVDIIFLLPEGGQTVTSVHLNNKFVENYIEPVYDMLTVKIVRPNYVLPSEWRQRIRRRV